ncbi:MAG: hypothetical protein KJ638_00060 [Chloroflexi bacterium]|nr:hypothetical protein [Chloroflexota bacterium]
MITLRGLAGIPGIEPMAADPRWGESYCDPPIEITPFTAQNYRALIISTPPPARLSQRFLGLTA